MLEYSLTSLSLSGTSSLLLPCLGAIVVYFVLRSIYRLYFHPLSKIPGPKFTAISHIYEFYYDVVKGGMFIFQIEKMHEKYGPIVRINPREVHVKDSSYYDEIYASGVRKRDKDAIWLQGYSVPTSMVSTVGHDHHRYRRNILNAFFSKRAVNDLSPVIEENVQKLMQRFTTAYREESIMHLGDAFAALASDVISQYSYGKSWNFLEDEHFRSDIRAAITETAYGVHINRFFPLYAKMLRTIPTWLVCKVQPGKTSLFVFLKSIFDFTMEQIKENEIRDGEKQKAKRETVHERLTDPTLPAEERTLTRVHEESIVLLQAGTESIGRALTICAFYLAHDPAMLAKLRAELQTVLPTPTSTATWTQLEQLPYLTGVLWESLRLSYGMIIRLPRCAPNEALQYKEHVIPPGTPISQSHYFVHHDEAIFPDSYAFKPERWIGDKQNWDFLSKHMVSFTRGSRQCMGMNLSYNVLYKTVAYFARRYDMELHDTTLEDLDIICDYGLAWTKNGDVEVSVKVASMLSQ